MTSASNTKQKGPSDDPVCDYYHYDGSELTYAGSIEDSVRNLMIIKQPGRSR